MRELSTRHSHGQCLWGNCITSYLRRFGALGLGDPMVARPPLPGSRMLSAGLLVVVATLAVVRWRRWLVQTVLSLAPPASHQEQQPLPPPCPEAEASRVVVQAKEVNSGLVVETIPDGVETALDRFGKLSPVESVQSAPQAAPDRAPRALRSMRTTGLRTADDRKMTAIAPFSPALAHWELAQKTPEELQRPSAWEFDASVLFVDISGFTNLCTRLDIDSLQRHINLYFGELIEVVTSYGGDVLRFAGDALFCTWSLRSGALGTGTLALATQAACRCALELTERCGTYSVPEVRIRAFESGPAHESPTAPLLCST